MTIAARKDINAQAKGDSLRVNSFAFSRSTPLVLPQQARSPAVTHGAPERPREGELLA